MQPMYKLLRQVDYKDLHIRYKAGVKTIMKIIHINIFKIRTKLVLAILIIVILSITGTKMYDYSVRVNELEKTAKEEQLNSAMLTATRLQTEISKAVAILETSANNTSFASGDKNKVIETLQSMKNQNSIFSTVFLADDSLNRINESGEMTSIANRQYMQDVKRTNETTISKEILISQATNKPSIMISSPVNVSGSSKKYLGVSINIDNLQNIIDKVKNSDSNYSFAFDGKSGLVFAHPVKSYIGKLKLIDPDENDKNKVAPELQRMAKEAVNKQNGTEIYNFAGTKIIAAYTNIPGTSFGVATRMTYEDAMAPIRKELRLDLIIILITSIISIIIALIIAKFISEPIEIIANQANIISSGDFTKAINIEVNRKDEIGKLQKSFKDMAIMLKSTMENIAEATSNIFASSKELQVSTEQSAIVSNETAETVSQVAGGTSTQLEHIDSSMKIFRKMGFEIQEISDSTSQLELLSTSSANAAVDGNKSISNAVDSITHINNTVLDTANVINALGTATDKISEIIGTISSIAAQTNLLALNASIEAARAGEQGRGFSVVAEEVRKLAEQSNESTNTITEIIDDIEKHKKNAIDKIDITTKEVSRGEQVILAAGESFRVIKEKIDNVDSSIKQITQNVKELSLSSNNVITSVEKIRDVSNETAASSETISAATEENAAAVEEVASSAESLSGLANQLEQIINSYKF